MNIEQCLFYCLRIANIINDNVKKSNLQRDTISFAFLPEAGVTFDNSFFDN